MENARINQIAEGVISALIAVYPQKEVDFVADRTWAVAGYKFNPLISLEELKLLQDNVNGEFQKMEDEINNILWQKGIKNKVHFGNGSKAWYAYLLPC